MGFDLGSIDTLGPSVPHSRCKKRKVCSSSTDSSSVGKFLCSSDASLPVLQAYDYFMEPCLSDLATRELMDPGYCSHVQDFAVGRSGYGCIRFTGETDVRWLDLDHIVKFSRHKVVVYEDETAKPVVGQGLNKAAEVTLVLQIRYGEERLKAFVKKLRLLTERQGADFISYDPFNGEWKFSVHHFSKFGLSDDDEEDITMDDAAPEVEGPQEMDGGEFSDIDDRTAIIEPTLLSHSLPAHLGLDPVKMRDMQMMMFSGVDEDEDEDDVEMNSIVSNQKHSIRKESKRSPLHESSRRTVHKPISSTIRKSPLALLEYNPGSFDSSSPGSILLAQQNKGLSLKPTKQDGFMLDLKHDSPVTTSHSRNVVDAALFMGRSFRVGWGPGGVLVHTGAPVGSNDSRVVSSVLNLEKVAFDKVVRDENNKVNEDLIDLCFDAPLNFHKELNHETNEVGLQSFKLKHQKLVCDPLLLSDTCRGYIVITEKQLQVPKLTSYARLILMHQVLVWELIKVLFTFKESKVRLNTVADNQEDTMHDVKDSYQDIDQEALQLIRRAEFSCWLQESVCHRVQYEVSSLEESSDLQQIFLLLTGRQVDAAVELSAFRGDVRLACLLSQAGGSTVNRSDISRQLDIWRIKGLDFNFIEEDRTRIFELLAGNIHGALHGLDIDWKRFLGLLMWYNLPPETSLPIVFQTYQKLLNDGSAPYPVPVYIDEGAVEEDLTWNPEERFDLAYYLMLLHACGESKFSVLKTMFSAFASTKDPLDYHMIWHQRAVLQAIGTFNSNDLHVLDMGLVSQLLSLGKCHWAIYVVLHIPYRDDYPHLHTTVIREILFLYCEAWSSQEVQIQFIEELGIPPAWLDEALALHCTYTGDLPKALEHYLRCANWQKAHSIFVTSVAHSLFLSAEHSEVWRIATSMEDHKSKIEDWDLGAGIYITFYLLKSSLQEENDSISELDALESKNEDCRNFLNCLNESLVKFGGKVPVDARVAYSKMAEEVCDLLLVSSSEGATSEIQLSCFNTVFSAPIPESTQSYHLQDAVSAFTSYLSEVA